jgi:secondary thiamine-phosphate synthase enzyme
LIFTNGDVQYDVYGSISKRQNADGRPSEIYGGIDVNQNGETLAALECDQGSIDFPWTDVASQ